MRTLAMLIAVAALPEAALAFSGGAPGYSGKPGGSGTCTACHDAAVTAPTLTITGPTTLAAGATGSYTLTVSGGPGVRAGWTIALSSGTIGTSQAGAFVFQNEVLQQSPAAFSGGMVNVAFTVVAPATAGTMTIYAAANSANGNGGTGGDKGTTRTLAVTITAGNAAPTVATAAAANPATVTGTTTALSVLGADDGGEANLRYTWSATGPAAVAYSVNGTNAAKNATATFTAPGSYSITCTIADAAGRTVTSTRAVTVNAALTTVTVSTTNNQVAIGQTRQFTAQGKDQFGANITATYTWAVSGGGTISTSGLFTAGNTPGGPFTVTAASGARSGTANVSVVAANAPTVAAAPTSNPSAVSGTTATLSVLGADDGGEANLTYTWSATTAPQPVTFSVNGTNGAKNTVATFTRAGAYALSVRIQDGAGLSTSATLNLNVSSNLSTVAVTPGSISVALNGTLQFTAQGKDQFGAVLNPQPTFTWTTSGGGTVNAAGLFSAGGTAGGPHTVTAASNGKSGTATVTISSGAPPTVAAAAASSSITGSNTKMNLSVLGADDGGEASLTYGWSMLSGPAAPTFSENDTNAAKNTVVTFTRAGSYVFQVLIKDADGLSVATTANAVVDQNFAKIAVAPATITLAPSAQQQFTGTAEDQFGRPMTPQPTIAWRVFGNGAISPSGLYTAPAASGGPYSVVAEANGATGIGEVRVASVQPPTVMVAASAMPAQVVGKQSQLSVTASDSAGEASLRYKWEMLSGPSPVGFSVNDSNSAKTTIARFARVGDYTLRVTITNAANLTSSSEVTVKVDATFSAVKVTPLSVTLAPNATQQFTARAEDQFGDELTITTPPAWSVSNGGTITADGLFTAQSTTGGPFTVTASSGTYNGIASVLVSDSSDRTPPSLSIAGVEKDQALADVVELTALVEDASPMATLSFIIDEKVVQTMSAAPFVWAFDTRELADGPHRISVMARDLAGNAARTAPMSFFVDNQKPTVQWRSPFAGAQVARELLVKLDVGDNLGAKSVTLFIDDAEVAVIEGEPWEAKIDISEVSNGAHYVDAVATDRAGNGNTARLKIDVENMLPEASGGMGCSAAGAAPALLALLALAGLARRRRWSPRR